VAYLLSRPIAARHILALTFTNKAADEMRLRLDRLAPHQPVWVGTFHRFCSRMLRMHAPLVGLSENFSIYDTDDSRKVIAQTMEEAGVADSHFTPDQIARSISWAKNHLIDHHTYTAAPGSPVGAAVARVFPLYQKRLLASSAVDFDDLLVHTAVLLRENPELRARMDERYRYIMVDEYQDTNLAQYLIVRSMSVDWPNLAVTGDPDQSIYGWRGANLRNILDFEQDYPEVKVVRLEQNYRSTRRILAAASTLIASNRRRKEKSLWTENDEGPPVRVAGCEDGSHEAEWIAQRIIDAQDAGRSYRDMAVFYRVNSMTRLLEESLRRHGIPYQIARGVEFYNRKEIKDVLAYLRVLVNPADEVSLLRIINTPARGLGKTTVDRLVAEARARRTPLMQVVRDAERVTSVSRAVGKLGKFVQLLDALEPQNVSTVGESVEAVAMVLQPGLGDVRSHEGDDGADEIENVKELINAACEYDAQIADGSLAEWLQQISLVSDVDAVDNQAGAVTLMTLHAAKGLEFPVVFMIGLEEGLLPHERSRHDDGQIEEERRLCFVGMTRAMEQLTLTHAKYRTMRGMSARTIRSQFLYEIQDDVEPAEVDDVSSESDEQDDPFGASDPVPYEDFGNLHDGELVRHPTYGVGRMVWIDTEADMARVGVYFERYGEKTLILEYANLERVESA
jgi:DNA helicase-2/ATP-dependent DNA helicase PcrA